MKNSKTILHALLLLIGLLSFNTQAGVEITYMHNDALGSAVAGTDEQGNVKWRSHYQPYGTEMLGQRGASGVRSGYTGHRDDPDSGLTYMGARYYSPSIGRFMGIDPQGVDEGNHHSFNRYAYANNNPYKYVDPDGEWPKLFVDFALNVAVNYLTTGKLNLAGAAVETVKGALNPAKTLHNISKISKIVAKGGTYKLRDADGIVKRTGKSNDLNRRRGEHARNKDTKDLDFEVDRRSDCCNAQRGREQIIYDKHPEAQAANGGLNKRRPVSPTNPKREIYRKAGEKL